MVVRIPLPSRVADVLDGRIVGLEQVHDHRQRLEVVNTGIATLVSFLRALELEMNLACTESAVALWDTEIGAVRTAVIGESGPLDLHLGRTICRGRNEQA